MIRLSSFLLLLALQQTAAEEYYDYYGNETNVTDTYDSQGNSWWGGNGYFSGNGNNWMNGNNYFSGNAEYVPCYDEDGNEVSCGDAICYDDDGAEIDCEEQEEEGYENSKKIRIHNCAGSVVKVKKIEVLCDSPYQWYYGNGAHRMSQLCDYGDQATVTVYFQLDQSLARYENIYMTMGIYAQKSQKELLWAVRSVELCDTFVGHQCNRAGSYAFAFRVSLDYAWGDRSEFVPVVEAGFSTQADEGYNLGGVNIDCVYGGGYRQYKSWFNGRLASMAQTWGAGGFLASFGFLFGAALLALAGAIYFIKSRMTINMNDGDEDLLKDVDESPQPNPDAVAA